jgi:superfamily I DNA/RNA helicase
MVNHKDDQSFLRIVNVPPRGLGKKAIENLRDLQRTTGLPLMTLFKDDTFLKSLGGKAKEAALDFISSYERFQSLFDSAGNLSNKVNQFLNDIGYLNGLIKIYKEYDDAIKRKENVVELFNGIAQFESNADIPPILQDYVELFSLLDESDKNQNDDEEDNNKVILTTVHSSKGLEYPFVFLVGMEQNTFPHERSIEEGGIDEERRLFYVAITRAKKDLVITHATHRWRYKLFKSQRVSAFLDTLPKELVKKIKSEEFFETLDEDEYMEELQKLLELAKS